MKVSVIIPAYNEEKYIERTLKSVFKSSKGHDTEVIIVANGCTDETVKNAKKFPSAKVIVEKKRGISYAKNLGAKKSKGDILVFLDADTMISSNAIKRILIHTKNYDFGSLWVKPYPMHLKSKFFMSLKNICFSLRIYKGTNGIIFCKRKIYDLIQGFDENLKKREDKDFIYKALKHGRYSYIKTANVKTSMRRFEKLGYFGVIGYWIKTWVLEKIGCKNGEYPSIR